MQKIGNFLHWWWIRRDNTDRVLIFILVSFLLALITSAILWSKIPLLVFCYAGLLAATGSFLRFVFIGIRNEYRCYREDKEREKDEVVRRLRNGVVNYDDRGPI